MPTSDEDLVSDTIDRDGKIEEKSGDVDENVVNEVDNEVEMGEGEGEAGEGVATEMEAGEGVEAEVKASKDVNEDEGIVSKDLTVEGNEESIDTSNNQAGINDFNTNSQPNKIEDNDNDNTQTITESIITSNSTHSSSANSTTNFTNSITKNNTTPITSTPPLQVEPSTKPSTSTTLPTTSSTSPNPNTNAWSYLRRAVANVESTLDKVLQESTEVGGVNKPNTSGGSAGAKLTMQERLAMAVGRPSTSPTPGRQSNEQSRKSIESIRSVNSSISIEKSNTVVRPTTPIPSLPSTPSAPLSPNVPTASNVSNVSTTATSPTQSDNTIPDTPLKTLQPKINEIEQPSFDASLQMTKELLKIVEKLEDENEQQTNANSESSSSSTLSSTLSSSLSSLISNLQSQILKSDEFYSYQQEKISVIESKLMLLAKQEADRAKKDKSSSSGIKKTLAEKEEYIALLLEEGQMLSKQELKHMNTIKKLRATYRDSDRTTEQMTRKIEKVEKELADTKMKLKKSIDTEKRQAENIKSYAKLEIEVVGLRRDKEVLSTKTSQLQTSLDQLTLQNDVNATKAKEEALKTANIKLEQLQTEFDKTKDSLSLQLDKKSGEIDALKNQIEIEIHSSNRKESALRDEIKSLEARVEHYRALSEESSTDSSKDDIHMNLLRQIEVLQSQNSIAGENWHEIEASLLSRISSLEKELEDSKNQEAYLVTRVKTISDNLKRQGEENEQLQDKLNDIEESLTKANREITTLTISKNDLQETNRILKLSIESDKVDYQKQINDLQQQLKATKEELTTITESTASNISPSGILSPTHPQSFMEALSPPIPGYAGGGSSGFYNEKKRSTSNPLDIFLSSTNNTTSSSPFSPTPETQMRRVSSGISNLNINRSDPNFSANTSIELPSMEENDDFFDDSATQDERAIDNNSFYATSGGASTSGVSLQLVGKMNMTIRRLESDIANCRQDLQKTSKAKDDAYQEVIRLMKDNEELKTYKEQTTSLQTKVQQLESREQTTLEMLGEKSELVQELKADVEDLKTMYRQQIEQLLDQLHKK